MNKLRTFRRAVQAVALAALASCDRSPPEDLTDLEEEVCSKTQDCYASQAAFQQLRLESNSLNREKVRLAVAIKADSQQTAAIQKEIIACNQEQETVRRTGVEPSSLKVGSTISLLSLNGKVYKEVRIKSIDIDNVTITHADGVSRVKSIDLLGQSAPAMGETKLPMRLPNLGAMASSISSKHSVTSASRPQYYSLNIPEAIRRKPSSRARPRTVDILNWWGAGNPNSGTLRDAYGRALTTRSDSNSGPAYSPRKSSKTLVKSGGALSTYRPIGWNYDGSFLDKIYGRRP